MAIQTVVQPAAGLSSAAARGSRPWRAGQGCATGAALGLTLALMLLPASLRAGPLAATGVVTPPPAAAPAAPNAPTAPSALSGLSRPKPQRAPSVGCLIEPDRVADIGSPVTGVIASIAVDRGDAVQQGQALIVLEHAVERAGLNAARSRAATDADVRAAGAGLQLADQRLKRLEGLSSRGFVSPQAVEQARTERQVAEQRLAQARAQRTVLAQELDVVRAQLGQRTLRSPFDGIVAERFVNAGERVEDRPLLRVAMLDPLRVELVVPATRWGSIRRGDRMTVQPELPGAAAVQAQVQHIDAMIDAASNTFRVRLRLPNPGNRLPAGARCRVDEAALGEAVGAAPPALPAAPARQG